MISVQSNFAIIRFGVIAAVMMSVCGAIVGQTKACSGQEIFDSRQCLSDDHSQQELELIDLIGRYRTANGKAIVTRSNELAKLANRRTLDLKSNIGSLTHSWSNCRYVISDRSTWPCVLDAPRRLKTGFDGDGFEVLYRTTSKAVVNIDAIDAWKRSELHNSIILNLGNFKDQEWIAIGVSIDGPYAAVWFGAIKRAAPGGRSVDQGLGVGFAAAVDGLAKRMSIKQVSTTLESTKWSGRSTDGKLQLDIFGRTEEITEAEFRITSKLDPERRTDQASFQSIVTFLKNVFKEWSDSEDWLRRSMAEMANGESASRTKVLREATVELTRTGSSLTIIAKPTNRRRAVEVY